MGDNSQSKIDVDDSLQGHLGHLTPFQEQCLLNFKQALEKEQPEEAAVPNHTSFDDPTLLRFLRARRFDVKLAQKQFLDTQRWRKEHDVDNLFATFPPDEFEDSKRFYPRWTGRRDNDGRPVYVYRLASVASLQQELHSVPPERRYQRIVALYEAMTRLVLPLCTSLPHNSSTPISSVVTIIDLEKVSFANMWALRNHLQEASKLATANYPETLHTTAIVNSPSFFPTIWRWVSAWFDEGTRRKIHVLGTDPGPILQSLIDPANLPVIYGGQLDWKFENEPSLDDPAKQAIQSMPKGPTIFVHGNLQAPTTHSTI